MSNMSIRPNFEPIGSAHGVKKPGGNTKGASFAETISETLKEVDGLQHKADHAVENLITGKSKNLHETMIALSKAEIAFKLTMQVRNKALEAYKEIMNTAV